MKDSLTENDALETLLASPLPPNEKRGIVFLVLAVLAVISETIEQMVSIRGILLILVITAVVSHNTKHLDVLIATLGGSLIPQTEKTIKRKTPSL